MPYDAYQAQDASYIHGLDGIMVQTLDGRAFQQTSANTACRYRAIIESIVARDTHYLSIVARENQLRNML